MQMPHATTFVCKAHHKARAACSVLKDRNHARAIRISASILTTLNSIREQPMRVALTFNTGRHSPSASSFQIHGLCQLPDTCCHSRLGSRLQWTGQVTCHIKCDIRTIGWIHLNLSRSMPNEGVSEWSPALCRLQDASHHSIWDSRPQWACWHWTALLQRPLHSELPAGASTLPAALSWQSPPALCECFCSH